MGLPFASAVGTFSCVFVLLRVLLGASSAAEAVRTATPSNPTYLHKVWAASEGLPSTKVYALIQSHDGYIWLGTEMGLARFNGLKFTVFTRKSHPEMVNDDCRALAEDNEGAIWIGTTGGLLRYREQRFTRFTTQDGLYPSYIHAICPSRSGGVWIATGAGLNRYQDGKLTRIVLRNESKQYSIISTLLEDEAGLLWVGGAQGLLRFDPSTRDLSLYPSPDLTGTSISALSRDSKAQLWAIAGFSLYQFSNGGWQLMSPGTPANRYFNFIVHDPEGGVWTSPGSDGLNRLFKGQVTRNTPEEWPQSFTVFGMIADREGNLWMATTGGFTRFSSRSIQVYSTHSGLSNPNVTSVFEDREGTLWVGSEGGLSRFQRDAAAVVEVQSWPLRIDNFTIPDPGSKFFLNYAETDGLIKNPVRALAQDDTGTLWVGTIRGVSLFRDGKFSRFPLPGELSGNKIHVIAKTADGAMWLGSELGLHCWRNERLITLTQSSGLAHNHIRALHAAHNGSLWVGTFGGGVSRLTWKPSAAAEVAKVGQASRLPSERHDASKAVSLALSTRAGETPTLLSDQTTAQKKGAVEVFDDPASPQVTNFTSRDGLSSDTVWVFHEEADGTLWIGTDHGLNRFKDGRFSVFTMQQGLPDDIVNSILEDDTGNLWIGCERGIYRISKQFLNDLAAQRTKSVEPVLYDRGDGMDTEDTNGQKSQPAAFRTRDGRLWFATVAGVAVINPHNLPQNKVPPPVVIEQVVADHEVVFDNANAPVAAAVRRRNGDSSQSSVVSGQSGRHRTTDHGQLTPASKSQIALPPGGGRSMEFHFTANSLTAPHKNRFKFRLEGHEKEWNDAGTRRTAHYTALGPGTYGFHVIACNNQNVWNTTGARFAFSIAPFFYQTWKFRGLCLLASVLLVGLVIWREKKILRLRHQLALQQQRAGIARDIHEKLGAKLTHLAILGSTGDSPVPPGDPPGGMEEVPQKNPMDIVSTFNAQLPTSNAAAKGASVPPVGASPTGTGESPVPPDSQTESNPASPASRIGQLAQQTIGDLTDLVWSVDPRCDTLEALVTYIAQYAEELCENGHARCRFDMPDKLPYIPLSADVRHNLFLAAKDFLRNIAHQDSPTETTMRVAVEASAFELILATNGSLNAEFTATAQRVQSIGATFEFSASPGGGSQIRIRVPIKRIQKGAK